MLLKGYSGQIETNNNIKNPKLKGGRPVGHVQAQPRSWTRDHYLEQIQLVVMVGLELGVARFQAQHPNYLVWLHFP